MNLVVAALGIAIGVGFSVRVINRLRAAKLLTPTRVLFTIIMISAFVVVAGAAERLNFRDMTNGVSLGLALLIGITAGFASIKFADLPQGLGLPSRLKLAFRFDPRLIWITASVILAIAATYYFAELEIVDRQKRGADSFWLPFYESWTASFAFWAVVGVIGTIVTLARPEDETYDERIRILFGGRSRPALRYLGNRIRSMGYFSTQSTRELIIEQWNPDIQAYKIRVVTKQTIVNLLHDQRASDNVGFKLRPDTFGPTVYPLGEITGISVNGTNHLTSPIAVGLDGLDYPCKVDIEPGGSVDFEISRWGWFNVKEKHTFTPQRFTEKVVLTVKNMTNLVGKAPTIAYVPHAGSSETNISPEAGSLTTVPLTYGVPNEFPPVRDVEPGQAAYELVLRDPI